jgi:hypothetical protein
VLQWYASQQCIDPVQHTWKAARGAFTCMPSALRAWGVDYHYSGGLVGCDDLWPKGDCLASSRRRWAIMVALEETNTTVA